MPVIERRASSALLRAPLTPLVVTTTQLSSAQILALDSTSVPVSTLPGPQGVLLPIGAFIRYRGGSIAYTLPGGYTWQLRLGLAGPRPFTDYVWGSMPASVQRVGPWTFESSGFEADPTEFLGQRLYLDATDTATLGNGTAEFVLLHAVLSLPA